MQDLLSMRKTVWDDVSHSRLNLWLLLLEIAAQYIRKRTLRTKLEQLENPSNVRAIPLRNERERLDQHLKVTREK